jgi:hypothetical protein
VLPRVLQPAGQVVERLAPTQYEAERRASRLIGVIAKVSEPDGTGL